MLPSLNKIKGIHPGELLKWELDRINLKSTELALEIGEHKQTISAIINKRRGITPKLSIKLSEFFKIDKDYFMLLQASYEVKKLAEAEKQRTPNMQNFRRVLFWDTDIDKIDWEKNKKSIIKRVFERGNQEEIEEIVSFYGKDIISKEIKSIKGSRFSNFENISKELILK